MYIYSSHTRRHRCLWEEGNDVVAFRAFILVKGDEKEYVFPGLGVLVKIII